MIKEAMPVRAMILALLVAGGAVTAALGPMTPSASEATSLGRGPLLHAHNCYPEGGLYTDRMDRALATSSRPIVIEQDLAWDPAGRRPVLSHSDSLTGEEPPLEAHFFTRVRPLIERALAAGQPDRWPLIVLHLDFKTNEPEHHRAVWDLLGKYESWLMWAPKVVDQATPQTLRPGPLLVLTEQGDGQEEMFSTRVPIGSRLRLFGTVPATPRPSSGDRDADLRAAAHVSPESLIPSRATNYRRWTNHSWAVVEEGGQARSGDWTAGDGARLNAIVSRAHAMGLWLRFYTLNGHQADHGLGWTAGYNFGSIEAVQARWNAAISAGVDFIATDQYEELDIAAHQVHPQVRARTREELEGTEKSSDLRQRHREERA